MQRTRRLRQSQRQRTKPRQHTRRTAQQQTQQTRRQCRPVSSSHRRSQRSLLHAPRRCMSRHYGVALPTGAFSWTSYMACNLAVISHYVTSRCAQPDSTASVLVPAVSSTALSRSRAAAAWACVRLRSSRFTPLAALPTTVRAVHPTRLTAARPLHAGRPHAWRCSSCRWFLPELHTLNCMWSNSYTGALHRHCAGAPIQLAAARGAAVQRRYAGRVPVRRQLCARHLREPPPHQGWRARAHQVPMRRGRSMH